MVQRKAAAGKARPTAVRVTVVHPYCAMRRGMAAMVNEVPVQFIPPCPRQALSGSTGCSKTRCRT